MDSYIVRIYRRTDEPPEFAGQVEKAGTEVREIFHNSAELVSFLTSGSELCGDAEMEPALLQNKGCQ